VFDAIDTAMHWPEDMTQSARHLELDGFQMLVYNELP